MSHTDMALINTKCEDNIELRKLVTETIRNYEEGQNENAQAAGVSVKRKFEPEEAWSRICVSVEKKKNYRYCKLESKAYA